MDTHNLVEPLWDVFLCHASEDKESVARPLAANLKEHGINVWFDEYIMTVGKSIRRTIDRGLSLSRYGVVILSPNFLKKQWPQIELNALFARAIEESSIILPVWHQISANEIIKLLPTMADRFATRTEDGLDHVTADLIKAINPKIKIRVFDPDYSIKDTISDKECQSYDKWAKNSLQAESIPVFPLSVKSNDIIRIDSVETKIFTFDKPIMDPDIGALVISRNNRKLACIIEEKDGLYLTINGKYVHSLDRFVDHTLSISQDGSRVACSIIKDNREYHLLDDKRLDFCGRVVQCIFSPDSQNHSIVLYRNKKFVIIQNDRESKEYDDIIHSWPIYSSDGRHLLYIVKLNGTVRLVLDGFEVARHEDITKIAFNKIGDRYAYVAVDGGKSRIILDGEEIENIENGEIGFLEFDEAENIPVLIDPEKGSTFICLTDESLGRFGIKPGLGEMAKIVVASHTFISFPEPAAKSPTTGQLAHKIPLHPGLLAVVVSGTLGPAHTAIQTGPVVFSPDGNHIAYLAENADTWSIFVDGISSSYYYDSFLRGTNPFFERNDHVIAMAIRDKDVFVAESKISGKEHSGRT